MQMAGPFWKKSCEEQCRISRSLQEQVTRLARFCRRAEKTQCKNLMADSPVAQMLDEAIDEKGAELERERHERPRFSCPYERIKDRDFA
jgi:hypothetical protein